MKLIILVVFLLITVTSAIDFTTIGQREIVDYIRNRADLFYGIKLSERNLHDLLSNAVFTGLEEEALIFAYGSTVNSKVKVNQLNFRSTNSADSGPLKITLTSDTLDATNIATNGLTTKSSSSKSSEGDFVVSSVREESFDSTSLDGSIKVNLGGANDAHNLTLTKTIYLAAEINVTNLGANWESSSLLTCEGKLLSMLDSLKGSLYIITYQSLIRETVQTDSNSLIGGLKSSGKVLAVINSDGSGVSLSGRTISAKFPPTWDKEIEEHVDQFLTINGSKSRKLVLNYINRPRNLVVPWLKGFESTMNAIRFDHGNRYHQIPHKYTSHSYQHGDSKKHYKGNWKPLPSDGSTWPSWGSFWDYGYGYRTGWDAEFNFDFGAGFDADWREAFEHRPIGPPFRITPKPPVKTTKKPQVITHKPVTTVKPVVTTPSTTKATTTTTTTTTTSMKPDIVEATTIQMTSTIKPEIEMATNPESKETTKPEPIVVEPEKKPDLSEPDFTGLPKGATISTWNTRII